MPIYQYRCAACEHEFEVFYTSFRAVDVEEKDEVCPKCDSKEKQRLVSRDTSFQLKGPGWARDRYGGNKN